MTPQSMSVLILMKAAPGWCDGNYVSVGFRYQRL
jgi:hypothetical protein